MFGICRQFVTISKFCLNLKQKTSFKTVVQFGLIIGEMLSEVIRFAKHMKGVCDHVDDLAVELNDTLGDITVESEDNLMEKTFNNPSLGFDCEFCDFIAKTDRGLKTHKTRKHCSCEWCDYICKDESDMKKHKFDKHTLDYGTELLKDCYL
jgi:hypothetical protein